MFGTMEAAPQGVGSTRRGLTPVIDYADWRAVMDSIQTARNASRNPERWNSVTVPARVALRAYTNVDKLENGCWLSRYSTSTHGYSQIGWSIPAAERRGAAKNAMVLAHRASWVHVHGQVPLGMTIDHMCRERRCVNPEHLRLLPNFENARRIRGFDWPMGECANGHSPTELVEITGKRNKAGEPRAGRGCRACYLLYARRNNWRSRHPGVPLPARLWLRSEIDGLRAQAIREARSER